MITPPSRRCIAPGLSHVAGLSADHVPERSDAESGAGGVHYAEDPIDGRILRVTSPHRYFGCAVNQLYICEQPQLR